MRLTGTAFQKTSTFSRKCSSKSIIELVKILRKETQAGVVDCRDALIAGNNDLQKAKDWLFDKAKITAAKKAGRSAQEGGVAVYLNNSVGVMVEINSETDFVAKEKTFIETCEAIARAIHENYSVVQNKKNPSSKSILELPLKTTISGFETQTIHETVQQLTFLYKENIQLRRTILFPQEKNSPLIHLYSYVHNPLSPNLGKIGAIVQVQTGKELNEDEKSVLKKLGNILATQVVGGKPYSIEGTERIEIVDDSEMCHEPKFEPAFLKQNCVLEDGTISKIISDYEKKLSTSIKIQNFGRWERNSGQEKEEANLLDDVQSLIKGSNKE